MRGINNFTGLAESLVFRPEQRQKDRNCGQHCVNFITGLGIELISDFIGRNGGTSSKDLTGALRWFGYECEEYVRLKSPRASSERKLLFMPQLGILNISSEHWTILFEGYVFDSCLGKFRFIDIERRKNFKARGYIEVNPKYLIERLMTRRS